MRSLAIWFIARLNSIRWIFHWNFSNFAIGILWSTGPIMWGLGTQFESSVWFYWAYIFFIAAFLWSLGSWLTSDALNNKNPLNWKRERRKKATPADWHIFRGWQVGVSILLTALFGSSIFATMEIKEDAELSRLHGRLYPDNDPIPLHDCQSIMKEDSLLVFLGGTVGVALSYPAVVIRTNGVDVFTLDKNPDGSLAFSLDVKSRDDRIIAQIKRGEFTINQNNILRMHRSDRSSLEVIDQMGIQRLNIRYLNPKAMWIDARLESVDLWGSRTPPHTACTANINGDPMMEFRHPPHIFGD